MGFSAFCAFPERKKLLILGTMVYDTHEHEKRMDTPGFVDTGLFPLC